MARSFGRLLAAIWDDGDFRPMSVGAKLMYGFLISQTDLEHSGIIPLRPARWARDLGEPTEDVISWLKELDQKRYVVTDEEAVELLVRSLIRRDDIWKQPNVFKSAAASARASKSHRIKCALFHEVRRLDLTRANRETQAIRDDLLTHLEPFGNPSPNPPEGFPGGSATSNGGPAEASPSASGRGGARATTDRSDVSAERAGQNDSGTLREGHPDPSAGAKGKGEGYGPVLGSPLPLSPSPSPRAGREPSRPPWLSAVPDARAEEGESFQDIPPDVGALVAEVRIARQDWSTRSIRRALDDPSVRERPWPVVRRAMLAVATDPASKHPGRLSHDGPWWHQSAAGDAGPDALPWCGQCAPNRRLEDAEGHDAGPCPECHPSKARAS